MKNDGEGTLKVGITGAGGKIGTVLSEDLAGEYDFTLFDNQWESKQNYNDKFERVKVDFSRAEEVEGIFEGLDVVIHLAASSNHVHMGYAMEETAVSLSPFYLKHRGYIRLDDPPAPDSYYGISKLFGEDLGWYYNKKYGIKFIALRIGSTGPVDDLNRLKGTEYEEYVRAMFLSRRDCVEAFRRALQVEDDFLIAYAISDNDRRIFDMKESMEKLGFNPQDNAEKYYTD
jgi:nucleoside-diphosphate-sugar epimerase